MNGQNVKEKICLMALLGAALPFCVLSFFNAKALTKVD